MKLGSMKLTSSSKLGYYCGSADESGQMDDLDESKDDRCIYPRLNKVTTGIYCFHWDATVLGSVVIGARRHMTLGIYNEARNARRFQLDIDQ
jgi:hypothetical protein